MWNEVNQGNEKRICFLKYSLLSYCKQGQSLKASIVHLYPKSSAWGGTCSAILAPPSLSTTTTTGASPPWKGALSASFLLLGMGDCKHVMRDNWPS